MEAALSAETPHGGSDVEPGSVTSGLAAEVAAETEAGPAPGGGVATPGGRRPGRPPIHGLYSKAAGSDGKNPVVPPGPATVDSAPLASRVVVPPHLLSSVVQKALKLTELGLQRAIEGKAILAGLTPADIDPQLQRATLPDESRELVAELTPLALQEWGMDVNVSPSVCIGLILLPWLTGSGMAYWTLASLAKERARRQSSAPASAPKEELKDHAA